MKRPAATQGTPEGRSQKRPASQRTEPSQPTQWTSRARLTQASACTPGEEPALSEEPTTLDMPLVWALARPAQRTLAGGVNFKRFQHRGQQEAAPVVGTVLEATQLRLEAAESAALLKCARLPALFATPAGHSGVTLCEYERCGCCERAAVRTAAS